MKTRRVFTQAQKEAHNKRCRENWATLTEEEKNIKRAKHNIWFRANHAKVRKETIEAYGGKCVCCGENKIEFLAIDHINGGGSQHRKRDSRATQMSHWLKEQGWPDGYRILCHNCNLSIGFYGYCPHGNLDK